MPRLTRSLSIAGVALAALLPATASAQSSAYGVNWSCGYEEGSAFIERLKRASEDDVSCLAGAGFWEETLPRIGGRMGEPQQRLRQLLLLIEEQDPDARAFFVEDYEKGQDEAILWLLIASGESGLALSDRRSRTVAVNLLISLPGWARERFASPLANALLAEGDNRAALTLSAALATIADDQDQRARATMIRARVIEEVGSVNEAVALYDEVVDTGNERLSAEAELRKIALMWRTGHIKTEEAVVVLRELVTVWRGENLGAGITLALARAYYFDQQLPQALRLLFSVAGSSAPEEIRTEAQARIRSIAEDLFVRRLDPATIGDLMDVYELVRPMMAPEGAFWMGDLRLSEDLARAGLLARAETLLAGAEPEEVAEAGGDEALLDMARIMVAFDDRARARGFLGAISRQALEGERLAAFERLEAQSLEIEDLKPILVAGARQDIITIIGERAWAAEAYGLYAEARRMAGAGPGWREPAAAYLSRGERLPRETVRPADQRLVALSSDPKPSVYHADDLRPLLEPSAEVAGLAVNLTQIGQELSESTPKAAPAAESDKARNET